MRLIKYLLLYILIFAGCVYDAPKEAVLIINTSRYDTIFIYSGHCRDTLDSALITQKYYFNKGFNSVIRNPYFIDPLDTQKLALGYTLLPVINSCGDKEAKVFIVNEKSIKLKKEKNTFMDDSMIDTIFRLTEHSIKNGIFYYNEKNHENK